MRVAILFGPDLECVDPLDTHSEPRRHYEDIPEDADVLVIWRRRAGDQDGDGHEDVHFAGQGVFENVRAKDAKRILRKLGTLD